MKLPFASLLSALVLTSACVIVADDDDEETTAATSPTTNGGTSDGETDTSPTSETAASGETGNAEETGNADGTGTAETGSSSTCGWGPTGETDVSEGYICGGDGADPNGTYDIDCPADLVAGDPCGEAVTGIGCCDANGDVWFCQDPDGPDGPEEPVLVTEDC